MRSTNSAPTRNGFEYDLEVVYAERELFIVLAIKGCCDVRSVRSGPGGRVEGDADDWNVLCMVTVEDGDA